MRVILSLRDLRETDLRAVPDVGGGWKVYEQGDVLPDLGWPAAAPALQLDVQAFRERFTDAELGAILSIADVRVKALLAKLYTRQEPIDMSPGGTAQQGLDLLQSLGLLTPARRAVIGAV